MNKMFEIWSGGKGQIFLYTEKYEVYQLLKKMCIRYGSYEKNGRTIGWQFSLPIAKLGFIENLIVRNFEH